MKLTVDIYELDGAANDVKVGEIRFDGEKITTSDSKSLLLTRMASVPIEVNWKKIDPEKEPERFVRNLWQHYFGPYLRAMKAATFALAMLAVTAMAQTVEPSDLALAAARLQGTTERPAACFYRYVNNPHMDADAVEIDADEHVDPSAFWQFKPLELPAGMPDDFVPVRVFQFRQEGWKFWGWMLLPMKDVRELHEDLETA